VKPEQTCERNSFCSAHELTDARPRPEGAAAGRFLAVNIGWLQCYVKALELGAVLCLGLAGGPQAEAITAPPARISGQKFQDVTANGQKDAGDAGLAGWTIYIDSNQNNVRDTFETATLTDTSGNYVFSNLFQGTYRIREVPQNGWVQTTPSPADINLNGVDVTGVDFGNFRRISISGRKFNDLNANGVLNAGEPGLAGWSIQIFDAGNGRLLSTAVTDGSGNYSFPNVGPGSYRIREVAQGGWTQTTANPADVVPQSGQDRTGINFGNAQPDTTPPSITCPANITTDTTSTACAKAVNYPAPTVSDNRDPSPTVVCNPPPGSTFPKGVTTVTCTATDASGNSATCTFTVTVVDNVRPVISCPANLSVNTDAGQCAARATFTVTATDNCPGVTVVSSPPSGSLFPIGVSTVTSTATDAAGNQATCSFTVTVTDREKPVVNCPQNLAVNAEAGQCSARATFNVTATDNCPGVTVVSSPPSGSLFPIGVSTVTSTATDAAGNQTTCSFTVTVSDREKPVVNCPQNLTLNAEAGQCIARATFNVTATDNCPGVTVTSSPPSGSQFPVGVTTVTSTATDAAGNQATCTFTVTVTDREAPVIICPPNIVTNLEPGQCARIVTFALPTATDNCGGNVLLASFPVSGTSFSKGTNTVFVQGTDAAGNRAVCSFTVTVVDAEKPAFPCPSNIAVTLNAGETTAVVDFPVPVVSDNCDTNLAVAFNPPSGSRFAAGNTTVTATATDASGNQQTCTFIVSVRRPITISARADEVIEGDQGRNSANVFLTLSEATDQIVSVDYSTADGTAVAEGDYVPTAGTATFTPGETLFRIIIPIVGDTVVEPNETFLVHLVNPRNASLVENQVPVTILNDDFPRTPPVIVTQPQGGSFNLGQNLVLSINATGAPPLRFQWRFNGALVRGVTGPSFSLNNFSLEQAGVYHVTVANPFGRVESAPAVVALANVPTLPLVNQFTDQVTVSDVSRTGMNNNTGANREVGEPNHANKRGGKSMWITWLAPASGIATFNTIGSTFDTVLGVYTGDAVDALTEVASDDDSGGFYRSEVRFNAVANTAYRIAVDGVGNGSGIIILGWNLEATADSVPQIVGQPASQTVALGTPVVFDVVVLGGGLTYQWFFDGAPIPNANAATLTLPNVQLNNLGTYFVRISRGQRSIDSRPARLESNSSAAGTFVEQVLTTDKFSDALPTLPGVRGGRAVLAALPRSRTRKMSLARGYSGTQLFSTFGSVSEEGEPNHCGVTGGASQWFAYSPPSNGQLTITTEGSDFDTVLAVYTGPGVDFASLVPVACDNDSGSDGQDSRLTFAAVADTVYYIAIDGVNGATGSVKLNYQLSAAPHLDLLSRTTGFPGFVSTGVPGRTYQVEASDSFGGWSPIFTTNSASGRFNVLDGAAGALPQRFYRVRLLP
jgi:hypothetical protein